MGRYDTSEEIGHVSMRDVPVVHRLSDTMYLADSGLPHLVVFGDKSLEDIDIIAEGHRLSQTWKQYASAISPILVNFVHHSGDRLYARCYDTGGLQEIISCGTASTAIAACHAAKTANDDVKVEDGERSVHWGGGVLKVKFHRENWSFTKLQLHGSVHHVFSGTYVIPGETVTKVEA